MKTNWTKWIKWLLMAVILLLGVWAGKEIVHYYYFRSDVEIARDDLKWEIRKSLDETAERAAGTVWAKARPFMDEETVQFTKQIQVTSSDMPPSPSISKSAWHHPHVWLIRMMGQSLDLVALKKAKGDIEAAKLYLEATPRAHIEKVLDAILNLSLVGLKISEESKEPDTLQEVAAIKAQFEEIQAEIERILAEF